MNSIVYEDVKAIIAGLGNLVGRFNGAKVHSTR